MNIEDNKVVSFHYTLSDRQGGELESSRDGEPMIYLHGAGNIVPGLEKAMSGKAAGDQFKVDVEPSEAYGDRQENSIQRVPAKHFKHPKLLKPGQAVFVQTKQGPRQVTVVKLGRFNIDIDTNHPMAGIPLTFDVEIIEVRDATEEEELHRHAHGPGGVEH